MKKKSKGKSLTLLLHRLGLKRAPKGARVVFIRFATIAKTPPTISACRAKYTAVRAYVCRRSLARRPGERVFSSFSTPCRNWSRWLRILSSTVSISARTRRRSIGFRRDLVRWNRDFETKILSPRSDTVSQVPASTFRILARSLRRSVGIQRNLGHWIRDFETKLQDPCLLNLNKVSMVGFNAFFAAQELLERWVTSVVPDWWVPSELTVDPYRLLASDCAEAQPQVPAAASSADQDRGKGVAS
uniref:Uncharacterized protein n=1 Tax=Ananas comosus var. bracteatus TaxID=296719 RepID=A0A6V7NXF6_ANACO|nr:unnamed protein product [Ananas comosus var. bracteatus]